MNRLMRRASGLYVQRHHGGLVANKEIRNLITQNPWYDPDLQEKLRGNSPEDLVGIDPDFKGLIAPPRNSLGWSETLTAATAAATAQNTYTTAKSVINAQNLIVFPANYFARIGQVIRVTVMGGLSTLVTTPGTTTYQIQCGPTANIVVFTTGAIQLNATAHTLLPFKLDILLTLRATGSGTGANFMGMAEIKGVMYTVTIAATDLWGRVSAADAAVSHVTMEVPVTAPAVGTGFDSTVANIFDFWTGFSISSGSNNIQVQQYVVESLN